MSEKLTDFMKSERDKAVEEGFGKYDRPAEAKLCAEVNAIYRGKHCKKPFVGIPFKDSQEGD